MQRAAHQMHLHASRDQPQIFNKYVYFFKCLNFQYVLMCLAEISIFIVFHWQKLILYRLCLQVEIIGP